MYLLYHRSLSSEESDVFKIHIDVMLAISVITTAFRLTSIDINGSDNTSDIPRGKQLSNVMHMTSLKHERYTTSGSTTSRYHDLAKRKGISEDFQSLKAKHQNGYKSTQWNLCNKSLQHHMWTLHGEEMFKQCSKYILSSTLEVEWTFVEKGKRNQWTSTCPPNPQKKNNQSKT